MALKSRVVTVAQWLVRFTVLASPLFLSQPLAAQAGFQVVRGTVTDSSQVPIVDAEVTILALSTDEAQVVRTGRDGTYAALFRNASGSYRVMVRRIGYYPVSRNDIRAGDSGATLIIPVVVLAPTIVGLPSITVRASLPSLANFRPPPPIGGQVTDLGRQGATVFALNQSDLDELAASVMGVLRSDGGYSVLGADANQNSTVVDGMEFGGAWLPRDAINTNQFAVTTFDPSQGGFAGGQNSVGTRRGSGFLESKLRVQVGDPHLGWSPSRGLESIPRLVNLSGYVSGPIQVNRAEYSLSWDVQQSSRRQYTLSNLPDDRLAGIGVSRDSLDYLRHSLADLGIAESGLAPVNARNTRGSAMLRLDYRPEPLTALLLTGNYSLMRTDGGALASAFPSTGAGLRSDISRLMLRGTRAWGGGLVNEAALALSRSSSHGVSYLAAPVADVRVGAAYDTGQSGETLLGLGGSSFAISPYRQNELRFRNDLSWLPPVGNHRVQFTQEIARSHQVREQGDPAYGHYSYRSLGDLALNLPTSFSRRWGGIVAESRSTTASLSLGDVWQPVTDHLELQGGLRYDWNDYGRPTAYHPELSELLGWQPEHPIRSAAISPRLGFRWRPRGALGPGQRLTYDADGRPMVSSRGTTTPSNVSMGSTSQPLTLSGGVGSFRGKFPDELVTPLAWQSGLPTAGWFLSCVGDAVPLPDWGNPGAAPDHCRDGSGPVQYVQDRPGVMVLDPGFRPPTSVRANLQVEGLQARRWTVTAGIVYSTGRGVFSQIDANMMRQPGFRLANEGGRPVFVEPDAVVPSTGLVAPGSGRVSPTFDQVRVGSSDLGYHTTQFNLTLLPPQHIGGIAGGLGYTFTDQSYEYRGFGGSTAGDPFEVEESPGSQPRHQFRLTVGNLRFWWLSLAAQVNLHSGFSFTPMVVGDINGDRLSNDRAFIPSPEMVSDPVLQAEFTSLLRDASPAVRDCLQRQMGHIATAQSCRTPWRTTLDVHIGLTAPPDLSVTSPLRLLLDVQNAGGALIRLLGLSNTILGQAAVADRVDNRLFYVNGFDPVKQQFSYRLNPGFGKATDHGVPQDRYPPFQVRLGLEYRLAGPQSQSLARDLGMLAKKGAPQPDRDSLTRALRAHLGNPVTALLSLRDSLGLSDDQVARLQPIEQRLMADVDRLGGTLISLVLSRGSSLREYDFQLNLARIALPAAQLVDLARKEAMDLLTPAQRLMARRWLN